MPSQANILNNQIKEYLQGKLNYNVGLSLFMRICADKSILVKLFGLETPEKKEILTDKLIEYYENEEQLNQRERESLRNFNQDYSSTRNDAEGNEDSFHRSNNYRFVPVSNLPSNDSVIESLDAEWRDLYRLRGIKHVDLFNAVSDENRHAIAKELIKIQHKIDGINDEKRKVKAGAIPERFIKQSRSAEEFIEIQNIKSYIKKYERKLQQQLTVEEREKAEQLLQKHKSKLQKIING